MAIFRCFTSLVGRKKKNKEGKESSKAPDYNKESTKNLQVSLEHPVKASDTDELKLTSFSVPVPFSLPGSSRCKVKVMSHESPVGDDVEEVAYEGEDEQDENQSLKGDYSNSDLQGYVGMPSEEHDRSLNRTVDDYSSFHFEINDQSGHVSDPGIGKAEFWASPKLKRSCSNLETRNMVIKIPIQILSPSKNESFEDLQRLGERFREEIGVRNPRSPVSVRSHCSADKVILKKHSSSQILPSRSRRLWWKLLLWSHRNLQEPLNARKKHPNKLAIINQQGGYSSDTLEPNRGMGLSKFESSRSFSGESFNRENHNYNNQSWDGFHGGSGLWPQNQWVAFPGESSSLTRVDEWVKEVAAAPLNPIDDENPEEYGISFPPSLDNGKSPAQSTPHLVRNLNLNLPEEIVHANSVIQSLNSSSTVAHISGIGLKVIPSISRFTSLRSVNLSGNFIVHIAPGSLPKGLHTLDLSRNKISTIEGLREITRLRVLNLSYNRISRIGQGLSNCTLIKELYLAGNKISNVEGLHRLLKLTILDLSFNKITTSKALGQLVANYNTLLALNLLGNPIQSNISDDQLRKALCSLLPKLAYLNKQPINPQKAREVATEAIARAALGNCSWNPRRKAVKRVGHSGASSSGAHRSNASASHKSRHRLRSRAHHQSPLKTKSSAYVSSNH